VAELWEDERVQRGMRAQLERRRERLAAGEQALGWKLGFGTPQAMAKLGTVAPLVGFLTSGTRVEPGATVSVSGFAKPVLEPEVAVHVGRDLAAGASDAEVRGAVAGLGPAIEVADVGAAGDDPEAILAGNVVHRAVLLGPSTFEVDTGALRVAVLRDGETVAQSDDPLAAVGGDLVALVRHVARVLEAFGEHLRAGEVIITGSTIAPPPPGAPGLVRVELAPLGALEVRLTA